MDIGEIEKPNKMKNIIPPRQFAKEVCPFFIPVIVCIVVFLMPSLWQENLIFSSQTINWWNWFTYIFVHESLTHLLGNIIIYSIAILFAYSILPENERKDSWLLILLILAITPVITLVLTLIFLPQMQGYSRGFSGITAGALGILCLAISRIIHRISSNDSQKMSLLTSSYLILLPSLAFLVWNLSFKLFALISLFWIGLIALIMYNSKKGKINEKITILSRKDSLKIGLGIIILLLGMLSLFPQMIKQPNGSIVNILAHFLGFVVGFLVMFFKASNRLSKKFI